MENSQEHPELDKYLTEQIEVDSSRFNPVNRAIEKLSYTHINRLLRKHNIKWFSKKLRFISHLFNKS